MLALAKRILLRGGSLQGQPTGPCSDYVMEVLDTPLEHNKMCLRVKYY